MKLRETKLREFTIKQKLLSSSLLISYVALLFFPVSFLFSQNVNYPNFLAPQGQQQHLDQYTSLANQSTSLNSWQAITGQGLAEIKSNWENAAVSEIESTVSSITASPNSSMTLQQYQNAVSAYLWAQENNAETQWLNQIDSQLSTARDNFINGQLAFNISHITIQNQSLSIVESTNQVAPASKDYRTALNTGLQKFSDSLTDLQRNYQQQLSSLNQTDAQYQANLQQLQKYENTVRQNMQTAVISLENSLKTTSLFYNTNPDGTTNWNSMTQAGTDLQVLITSLDQGFANGTPVSALANQMVTYLQTQELQAQTNANYWAQQATPYNAPALTGTAFGIDRQIYGASDLVAYGDSIASQNPIIGAIKAYIDGGSNPQDSTLINYLYSNYFNSNNVKIVGINNADFYGYRQNYNVFPATLWSAGGGANYSSAGYNAFDFTSTGLWAFGIFLPVTGNFTEDQFQYSIKVQVQDLNAQANATAWNGFVSSLTTELNSWNTITPSIANMESQVSAYQAQYAAWHAQEVVYKDSLQQSFATGVQSLTNQQQTWENNLKNSFSSIASSGEKSDDLDRSRNVDSLSPKIVFNSLPVDSKLLSSDTTAPVIDQSSLNNTLSIFQQSLMGASNLALENQINKQAIEEKANAVNRIASSLGSNAVVDSHGNIVYTTAIEDGHAKLKAGGDATISSDYEATKVNESVYLSAPATIKIAAAGDLFQTWDMNSVISANQASENSFSSSYNSTIHSLDAQIAALNSLNAKNDASFQEEAQAAASYATNVQSLAKAMLQGGTFESWAKGQIQDKVNAAMAQAIATATGMSPDMASQLVSWFEKNQAEKKAKAKARTQEITSGLVTVASIMASFIAGPEMMAVGQAVLQAAQGYQNGGMEGALVGAASGAATAYAREFGVNVGVSYSYSGGFGGTLGLGSSKLNAGVTFSQHGSTSFNMGGSYGNVSYNPTSGFSGSVNLTPGQNTGVMLNVAQHSGPSLTVQHSDEATGVGASVTIDGKGNTTVAATYRNATVVSATGNVHDPGSFGNLTANDNFNNDLNQNLAMGKADANLTAGRAELAAGRNAIAASGNDYQREVLNDPNASAQDKHDTLVSLSKANELAMDPSSASTWLGRTTQDVVGSFLGSTGLGASDSNGFIDKNGKYVQRTCFTAETLIRTKDGLKRIDQIRVGDYVLSINENSGKVSYKRVTQLFVHDVGLIHRVMYENGSSLDTTWNHPFYLRGKGWTEVRDINVNERSVTIGSIRNSEKSRVTSDSGVLLGASLASLNRQTSNQEYSNSWKNEYRGTLGITKIEEVYTNTKVYNFEVEDNHTYFVGKDGVLVHNYLPEFVDQINQRSTQIASALQDPSKAAQTILESQFSREGLQRTALNAATLGAYGIAENALNATGVNGEEAAARSHADTVFDAGLGLFGVGIGKAFSSLRGLSGAAREVSAGSKATGAVAAEEGAIARKAGAAANGESQASQFIFDSNLGKNGGYRDAITGKIVESNTFGKSLGEYSAVKPGPLQDKLAETFAGGRYREIKLQNDTILYRAGTAETPFGQFYSLEPPGGILQTRIDKAVKPVWSNGSTSPIDSVITIRIPAGTKVYAGKVGTQGGFYVGGTQQIVIPDAWAVKGAKVLNISPLK